MTYYAPCGCFYDAERSSEITVVNQAITFCPKHAAADDLIEALKAIADIDDGDEPLAWLHYEKWDAARAALEKGGVKL